MTRHYPIEITLTRPASCGDCTVPASVWRSPTTADRTRLMTIQSEKSPGSALHRMRRRIGGQLPVDSWPPPSRTRSGHLLVNAALGRSAKMAVRRAAAAHSQRSRDNLGQRLAQGVERNERKRHHPLTAHLESLLHQHPCEELLTWAASLLSRRHSSAAL